jgi:putative transposase
LVSEAVAYYHEERPHQGKENDVLMQLNACNTVKKGNAKPKAVSDNIPVSQIECRERLGGLLKHYRRAA